jgi:peptidoglycan/xylan/chitin deacetylase (PgdA/CDA1 family)
VSTTAFVITSCVGNKNLMWRNQLSAIRFSVDAERFVGAFNAAAPAWGQNPVRDVDAIMIASMRWPMANKEERAAHLWEACGLPSLADYLDEHKPYMTWDDLDIWVSRGHSVGLHTHTHPICADLDAAQVDDEIVKPSATLKEKYGVDEVPFSYPFGIRLPSKTEKALFQDNTIQCALGARGSSPIGTPAYQLERADVENGLAFPVFGKRLTLSALPFLRS